MDSPLWCVIKCGGFVDAATGEEEWWGELQGWGKCTGPRMGGGPSPLEVLKTMERKECSLALNVIMAVPIVNDTLMTNHFQPNTEAILSKLYTTWWYKESAVTYKCNFSDKPRRGSHGGRRWCRVTPSVVSPPDGLGPLNTADRLMFVPIIGSHSWRTVISYMNGLHRYSGHEAVCIVVY